MCGWTPLRREERARFAGPPDRAGAGRAKSKGAKRPWSTAKFEGEKEEMKKELEGRQTSE